MRKNIKRLAESQSFIVGLFFLTKHPLENEITMLDVGQGESIFLQDVTGKTILIDVGGKSRIWQENPSLAGKGDDQQCSAHLDSLS